MARSSRMKNILPQAFSALFLLTLSASPAQAVGGSSFAACVAEGEVTYAPATAATLSAAAGA
ncbi:MAG: hypothetical protein M0041_05900, partial [Nitrospiraceae bacterium]|nr:hypothetical protein [Nitrospiraceae bacterium]